MPPVGYIAYIDEAGDDGLRKIKTNSERGASEWMVLSAVLVKSSRESDVVRWAKSILEQLGQRQLTHIHFRQLREAKRVIACEALASLSLRIFILLSHKQNMEGYRNLRAEKAKVNDTAWFYCWMTKLLLERVTAYCARRTMKDYGGNRTIRFEFSDRGGVKLQDVRNYYTYNRWQSEHGLLHDPRFDLDWSVIDVAEMQSFPNKMRAGLQLADIAASAFFSGVEPTPAGGVTSLYGKLLCPRICQDHKFRRYGFGVKLMPVWVPTLPQEPAWDLINFYRNR